MDAGCACEVAPPNGADGVAVEAGVAELPPPRAPPNKEVGAAELPPPRAPPNKLDPNPPEVAGCEVACGALVDAPPRLENKPPGFEPAAAVAPVAPPNKEGCDCGCDAPDWAPPPPRFENKLGVEPDEVVAVFPPNKGANAGVPEDAVALEAGLPPKLPPKSDIVTGGGNVMRLRCFVVLIAPRKQKTISR